MKKFIKLLFIILFILAFALSFRTIENMIYDFNFNSINYRPLS
jgi:hypothetical protein